MKNSIFRGGRAVPYKNLMGKGNKRLSDRKDGGLFKKGIRSGTNEQNFIGTLIPRYFYYFRNKFLLLELPFKMSSPTNTII